MNSQPYLIFELNHKRYGLEAHVVEEIFLLPEITTIPEASPYILGVINLRGGILPIFDLSQRLEARPHRFAVSDSVIVIANQQQRVGLVVSQVYEVEFITPQSVESDYLLDSNHQQTALIAGIAKLDSQLINLVDAAILTRFGESAIALSPELPSSSISAYAAADSEADSEQTDYFFPTATASERQILHARAQNLLQTLEQDNSASLTPLAVIRFGKERFAIAVDAVQEFTDIRQVTPVPCCPAHIIGNMNLRGEVLTLVDIRHLLQLQNEGNQRAGKAVVVKLNELVAGIAVDEVSDVVYVHPSEISAIPTAGHTTQQDYLRGVVAYDNSFMGVLDLPEILTNGELVVNETV